ncbi:MAG: TRAP transporter small permease subunit [Gammaproteobacteria bacterium]|nr:TRAP transporter small permease subunit [Gammaproteobacteria bacterium]MCP5424636.1 TRAP transporter small permease subunit [Gammaproteobacteria bacterium]MCP5460041.1 TRAP transporter small permease subunit [Gammaproteobacteria bacterium]
MNTSVIHKLARTVRAIDTFSEWTGRSIAWLTLAMVLVQFIIVVLRYAFDWNRIYIQEIVVYLHATVFLIGAAYTLKHDGHVRVDIFYREMQPKNKALVNLFGTLLLLLPTFTFIFWTSWRYVMDSWSILEGSREAGGLPAVYLLKTAILVMAALMMLQGLAEVLRNLLVLVGHPLEQES